MPYFKKKKDELCLHKIKMLIRELNCRKEKLFLQRVVFGALVLCGSCQVGESKEVIARMCRIVFFSISSVTFLTLGSR